MMRLFKIRKIGADKNGDKIGVSIPHAYVKDWINVRVEIYQSGTALILESGAIPSIFSKKEIDSFSEKIEVIRI